MDSIDKIVKNILGNEEKEMKKENIKEPSWQDCKDGLKGIVKPFKDLYDKGVEYENEVTEKIKRK